MEMKLESAQGQLFDVAALVSRIVVGLGRDSVRQPSDGEPLPSQ